MERLKSEWQNLPKRALEAIAVEGYRSGALSRGQVRRILGLSWHETEAFLKEREVFLAYDDAWFTMPSREAAMEMLSSVLKARSDVYPAIGEGEDIRLEGKNVLAAALVANGRLIHLCGFRVEEVG
jgi:predicted HTH domain antitoxin